MRTLAAWLLPLVLVGAVASRAPADDKPAAAPATKKIDNPEYANWAAFKVGAFVELTTETNQMGNATKTKHTTKLVELTAEKAVLEMTLAYTVAGQETALPADKREVPKVIEVPDVKAPETKPDETPKVKEGEDTVEVAGKKFACKTMEATYEMAGGMKTWSKTWLCKDMPGNVVRQETKTEGKVGDVDMGSTSKGIVTKYSTGS